MTVSPWPSLVSTAPPSRYLNRRTTSSLASNSSSRNSISGSEESLAVLSHPLKVVLPRVGDFGHLHGDHQRCGWRGKCRSPAAASRPTIPKSQKAGAAGPST